MLPLMASNRQTSRRRERNTKLHALRINDGLSRDDLARRAGVSRETIRLAELGFVPGPRIQFALADAFNLRPLDIWPLERQRMAA